jgi:hypothetical protein
MKRSYASITKAAGSNITRFRSSTSDGSSRSLDLSPLLVRSPSAASNESPNDNGDSMRDTNPNDHHNSFNASSSESRSDFGSSLDSRNGLSSASSNESCSDDGVAMQESKISARKQLQLQGISLGLDANLSGLRSDCIAIA